jgi:hypothetical protein
MGLLLAISLLGNALAIVLVLWGWYAGRGRLARERAATFVDLTPVFTGTNGAILPAYSNDDLHLLGPGYLAWQRVITPVVADALRARAPCEREIPRSPGAPALAAKPPD